MLENINLDEIDITREAPSEEPERQYYYMAKVKNHVDELKREIGRPLTACCVTFGCQMNARDSEKLMGILKTVGFEETESEDADLVLYNTCTVRENANLKVYGRLGHLGAKKKNNPNMIIGLCGCMMQEPDVVEKIKTSYKFVDLVFGTHNIYKLAELLDTSFASERTVIDIWKDTNKIVEALPSDRKFGFKQGVNITFGCNNFCTYCIVPYVRGRERSREPIEIIREIEKLVKDGVVEVMLLGQNVNSYGKNLSNPITFAELLKEVEKIEGLERIRFMTPHPKDLSDELIQVMKNSKKICNHVHLPLQSGSSRILEKMNRRYTKEHYLNLVEKIRSEIPQVAITTDIIVGFPGETEEDFLDTLDVVKKAKYDSAYTFIYSKRTGTPAASMDEQVPEDVVKDRFDRLLAVMNEVTQANNDKYVGSEQLVLVEAMNDHDNTLVTGRMTNNTLVHFPGDESMIGKILKVKLTKGKGFYYFGERIPD